ncbi:uncharacterized protein LOC144443371 [Glandiceps talaboti]
MKCFYTVIVASLILCITISVADSSFHRESRDVTASHKPAEDTGAKKPSTVTPNDDSQNKEILSTTKSGSTNKTNTSSSGIPSIFNPRNSPEVVKRMLYVLLAVTAIVVVYFVFRAVRLRRRRSKSKKYGVLTSAGGDMEMAPLDQDEEEDDMTVFDVNNAR